MGLYILGDSVKMLWLAYLGLSTLQMMYLRG